MGFISEIHSGSRRLSGQFPGIPGALLLVISMDLPLSMEMRSVLSSSSCIFLVTSCSPLLWLFPVSPPFFLLYDDAAGRAGSHNSASLQILKRCLSGRHAALWPTWLHFQVEHRGGVLLSS